MKSIAVIGSNMVDLISYIEKIPKAGETLEAPSFKLGCGGKGANQAVAAAKLGSNVMMISKVGDDMFADNTIRNLLSYGIETKYVKKVPHTSSGVAPVLVDDLGRNATLIIKGANDFLSPHDIDEAAESLKKVDLIVLQLEAPLETIYYVIEFGNKHNVKVILNASPVVPEFSLEQAGHCEFIIVNEKELIHLSEMEVETTADRIEAARKLLTHGFDNVIVTMGINGSLWVSKDGGLEVIDAIKIKRIDNSGVNDAFVGCFAHYFSIDGDVVTAVRNATLFSAHSVSEKGTQFSYPSVEQFQELQRQYL